MESTYKVLPDISNHLKWNFIAALANLSFTQVTSSLLYSFYENWEHDICRIKFPKILVLSIITFWSHGKCKYIEGTC